MLSLRLTHLGIILCLLALAGCARDKAERQAAADRELLESFKQQQTEKLIREAETGDPYLRSQTHLGLEAQWAGPGELQITVTNKTSRPMEIGPKNFGIVLPPNRTVIPPRPESEKTFPRLRLAPGEQASGVLLFPAVRTENEVRLVSSHPQARPAMARVE